MKASAVLSGLAIACLANSILFFVPTYIFHTLLYSWLERRRVRFDKPQHHTLTWTSLWHLDQMDAQFKREFLNGLQVAVSGLSTMLIFQFLVEKNFLSPLESTHDWKVLAREFLVYFISFDCYYYFLQ